MLQLEEHTINQDKMSRSEIVKIIEGTIGESGLTEQTNLNTLAGWSSLSVMSLMAELDSEYDVQIDIDKLGQCKTVDDLVTLVITAADSR